MGAYDIEPRFQTECKKSVLKNCILGNDNKYNKKSAVHFNTSNY